MFEDKVHRQHKGAEAKFYSRLLVLELSQADS